MTSYNCSTDSSTTSVDNAETITDIDGNNVSGYLRSWGLNCSN